jgi:hypothetical protein
MATTTLQYISFSIITIVFTIYHCLRPGDILYEKTGGGETDEYKIQKEEDLQANDAFNNDNTTLDNIEDRIGSIEEKEAKDLKKYGGYENIIKENEKYATMIGGQKGGGVGSVFKNILPKRSNFNHDDTPTDNLMNRFKKIIPKLNPTSKSEYLFLFCSMIALIGFIITDLMMLNINEPLKYLVCLAPIIMIPIAFVILKILPGWKSIFADTFGYLLNFGSTPALKTFVNNTMDTNNDSKSKEIIEKIYSDPSIYYSILTPENFNDHLEHLLTDKKLQDIEGSPNSWTYQDLGDGWNKIEESAKELGKSVLIKDYIGKYCWYLLFGIYAISISSSIISGYTPVKTEEEIETEEDALQQKNIDESKTRKNKSKTTAPVVASLLNTG